MARSAAAGKLSKYQSMRDFSVTREPSGASPMAHPGHSFVIQQHAARRMHYDFRLELDGVLLSWSVPKGPSLSPTTRRLAVRTEDHPLDYAGFEGIIPAGQYGGGAVVVWDRGSWQPDGDARAAMAKGRLTFTLHGEKLSGRWHLVKTRSDGKAENWLLFKGRDEAADDKLDIVAARPASVLSGRTVEEIAAAPERVWQSNRAVQASVSDQRDNAATPAIKRTKATKTTKTKAAKRTKAAKTKTAKTARSTAAKIARSPRSSRPATPAQIEVAGPSQSRPAANNHALQALLEQLPLGFQLTNLGKVLYPEQGVTKGELIAYLAVVADWALPHLARRPLTLVRCPEGLASRAPGRGKACFFQKHRLPGSPASVQAVAVAEDDGGTATYMQVHDMAGLVALAQLGTLEIHTWGCHTDQLEKPNLLVFDLDPDVGLAWEQVALGALDLRRRLRDAGLESFVKTTGGKGLHVVAPIHRGIGWDDFKAFTRALVETMERDEPDRYTTNISKARRKGRIFLDYLRNGRGATFIAPYSPRARPGAPVAVPIRWEELAHGVDPATFTMATVPRRLAMLGDDDPWKQISHVKQSITASAWRAVGGKPA